MLVEKVSGATRGKHEETLGGMSLVSDDRLGGEPLAFRGGQDFLAVLWVQAVEKARPPIRGYGRDSRGSHRCFFLRRNEADSWLFRHYLAADDDFYAPVQLATCGGAVVCNRVGFAQPFDVMLSGDNPCVTRNCRTVSARCCESVMLKSAVPVVSV